MVVQVNLSESGNRRLKRRNDRGHALSEFGAAMTVFICFFLAPMIDLSFVPVRYLFCQGAVTELTHRLSLSEKRTDAYNILTGETWWRDFLSKCGVTVHTPDLKLVVCGQDPNQKITVGPGVMLADEWLPGGSKGPCVYSLELTVTCDIPPLFNFNAGLPGFSGPIPITLKSRSQWENLGRNPQTGNYYINE